MENRSKKISSQSKRKEQIEKWPKSSSERNMSISYTVRKLYLLRTRILLDKHGATTKDKKNHANFYSYFLSKLLKSKNRKKTFEKI